jgi:alpha-beta hydrolase superfamily lysophospholipase
VVGALGAVGAFVTFFVGLPAFLLSAAVHRPQGTVPLAAVDTEGRGEPIRLRSADGTPLSALWFPHPQPRGAVLLVHGIGAEKVQFLPATRPLYERGLSVLTVDLRNHGQSGGATCTFGIRESEDVAAAWAFLLERSDPHPGPRLLFGISMGGGAAQIAAPRLEGIDGLILDSTFARIDHVATRVMPVPGALALGRFFAPLLTGMQVLDAAPIEASRRNPGTYPVMVIHAVGDPLVPYEEGQAVAAAYGLRAELVTLPGSYHPNGHVFAPELYREALERLTDRAASRR